MATEVTKIWESMTDKNFQYTGKFTRVERYHLGATISFSYLPLDPDYQRSYELISHRYIFNMLRK